MAGDDGGVKRRRPLRRLASAQKPPPLAPAVEPSFVCSICRRDMLLTERSRISLARCRACV